MKKYLKILALLCAVMLLLCACGDTKPNETESTGSPSTSAPVTNAPTTEESTTAAPTASNRLVEQLKSGEYSVVYPADRASTYGSYVTKIRAKVVELGQKFVKGKTDYVSANEDPDSVSEYEILLGYTNRSAGKSEIDSLGSFDYLITVKENRIIIAGGSDYILEEAVNAFVAMLGADEVTLPLRHEEMSDRQIIRFGSYNIHVGGADVDYNLKLIGEDILNSGAEIIGLQEVDMNNSRNKLQDTIAILTEQTGYYGKFTKAISLRGGEYGTAILSKYPIEEFSVHTLPNDVNEDGALCEARSFGHAVINVNGKKINFINTHLTHESESLRALQYGTIVKYITDNNLTNVVVTADFNTTNFELLKKVPGSALAFDSANGTAVGSFGASQIDNVVYTTADFTCVDAQVIKDVKHSDHCMIWADLIIGDVKENS